MSSNAPEVCIVTWGCLQSLYNTARPFICCPEGSCLSGLSIPEVKPHHLLVGITWQFLQLQNAVCHIKPVFNGDNGVPYLGRLSPHIFPSGQVKGQGWHSCRNITK